MNDRWPGLELAAVVDEIRTQLTSSVERSNGQRIQFLVEDIDVELNVAVTQSDSVGGGVKLWVLNADGTRSDSANTSHRVRVTLKAQDTTRGESLQISDGSEVRPPQ